MAIKIIDSDIKLCYIMATEFSYEIIGHTLSKESWKKTHVIIFIILWTVEDSAASGSYLYFQAET